MKWNSTTTLSSSMKASELKRIVDSIVATDPSAAITFKVRQSNSYPDMGDTVEMEAHADLSHTGNENHYEDQFGR